MESIIKKKIFLNFNPDFLEIKNNSHLHKGHLSNENNAQTHFHIKIKSNKFNNISKIEAHRMINKALEIEFKNGLHALEIKII